MTGSRELTLEELAESAGMTPRNVRAYQARGLLPPPIRNGRNVTYGPQHAARLRLVRSLHQRGLSLRVVRDLIDRGDAEAELARLAREQLLASWGRDALVPMLGAHVEAVEALAPGTLQAMADAGIVVREGDRWLASATGLGLASALVARGFSLEDGSRISHVAAAAADHALDPLCALLEEMAADADTTGLVVQLAATAFSDVLARRLGIAYPGDTR